MIDKTHNMVSLENFFEIKEPAKYSETQTYKYVALRTSDKAIIVQAVEYDPETIAILASLPDVDYVEVTMIARVVYEGRCWDMERYEATRAPETQRLHDLTPCRTCGGDRLRADFTDSARCHAPLPEAPTAWRGW